MKLKPWLAPFLVCVFAGTGLAIKDAENQERWEKPCQNGPDAEVPGFLVNMGPTGARGILKERSFVVKYIFKKSPAVDLLQIDDEVYGANGKRFSEHTFGGGNHGIEGPIQDLGLAIEDSEGEDGVLKLMVERDGSKMEVDVQLEKLGRFADSFPVDCEKTKILRERANQYLMDHPNELDSQGRCVAALALMSSDDRKAVAAGKQMVMDWNKPYSDETWSWHLGFQGIALSEYYLLTGDRKVLKTLESSMDHLWNAQWKGEIQHWKAGQVNDTSQAVLDKHQALYQGGFGHEPYHVILKRGGGGYGPMQWPTCLALMTWQLGKQCGIEVEHAGVENSFRFLDYGTTDAGKIAYGGEFTLNNGPIDHKQWKASMRPGASHKSGLGYLVFQVSPDHEDAGKMQKLHLANIDASYKDMPDGHACALMGFTWGQAGVYASDDEKLKEKVSEYYKAWWNMARCHGSDSYVILPGRDYADESYYRGNIRTHTTAAAAFIYSFATPKLRIHGSDGSETAKADSGTRPAIVRGELRRFYNADRSKSFEGRLLAFDPRLGVVQLVLKNGSTQEVEFLKLSKEDQEYLKESLKSK